MAHSSRNPKPTVEQLIAYAAGDLSAAQTQTVAEHIRSDPEAAATVAAYRAVRETLQSDDSVVPPADLSARAKAIFRSRAAEAASRPGVLAQWMQAVDRLVATILYDSRVQPAAVRFADPAGDDRVSLTFQTATREVDLQAERLPHDASAAAGTVDRWRIMGQISDDSESADASRDVALVERGSSPANVISQSTADQHGMFTIEAPAGTYELLVRDGHRAIVLTPIELE